jgi:hypothetical protein
VRATVERQDVADPDAPLTTSGESRMRHLSYRAAAIAIVLTAGCLSACSGSGGSSGSSEPTGDNPFGASAGSADAASTAKATCDQLTVADVQPMVSGTVTKAPAQPVGAGDDPGQDCAFDGPDDGAAIDVTVLEGSFGQQAYESDLKDQTNGSVPVSGVGDKASHNKGDISVSAMHGSLYCSVRGTAASMPGIGDWELSHGGTSDVPDSIVEPAVNIIGTLCNKVFGSGNTTPDLSALKNAVAAAG